MFAMVARTASIGRIPCRIPAAGSQAARVTHTLLFLAAQIALLSPGVCDACVKGCCASGTPRIADVASPILASNLPSFTAIGCCGSDHGCSPPFADPVTEKVTADRGTADVTAVCCCELLPRQIPPANLKSGGFSGRREIVRSWASVDAALPVGWLPPLNGRHDGVQSLAVAQESAATIPSRPVRVLYGVWRN